MVDAAYRKVGDQVMLRGRVSGGTAPPVFTLPEGFRPTELVTFDIERESGRGCVTILPDGSILVDPDLGGGWASLDGIVFLSP